MISDTPLRRKPRSLTLELVEVLGERIRNGGMAVGSKLPTEAAIMAEFGVSRTVVRETISKLQASGLVETRHGIGTFVLDFNPAPAFKVTREQLGTLRDVIALLELRMGVETEAAALAALRRTNENLEVMRNALDAAASALEKQQDAVVEDFQFHLEIAKATQNSHFVDLMGTLGNTVIPRARLQSAPLAAEDLHHDYLERVNAEHECIYAAIAKQDANGARLAMRTHLANSRERRRRTESLVSE